MSATATPRAWLVPLALALTLAGCMRPPSEMPAPSAAPSGYEEPPPSLPPPAPRPEPRPELPPPGPRSEEPARPPPLPAESAPAPRVTISMPALSEGPVQGMAPLEGATDRHGSDYYHFTTRAPDDCAEACARDERCLAFTYVRAGVQGRLPVCWLKTHVPGPAHNECCVSGVKVFEGPAAPAPEASGPMGPDEWNIGRDGSDYAHFIVAAPGQCREACARDGRCRAFTYVGASIQARRPVCWLKHSVPRATPRRSQISGVKLR